MKEEEKKENKTYTLYRAGYVVAPTWRRSKVFMRNLLTSYNHADHPLEIFSESETLWKRRIVFRVYCTLKEFNEIIKVLKETFKEVKKI